MNLTELIEKLDEIARFHKTKYTYSIMTQKATEKTNLYIFRATDTDKEIVSIGSGASVEEAVNNAAELLNTFARPMTEGEMVDMKEKFNTLRPL